MTFPVSKPCRGIMNQTSKSRNKKISRDDGRGRCIINLLRNWEPGFDMIFMPVTIINNKNKLHVAFPYA